jgi:putative N6-adenine-specific DNA methylase
VSTEASKLYHEGAIAERVAGALEDHFGTAPRVVKAGAENEGAQGQMILARILHDECVISLDTTGPRLHQRGYRLDASKAPIRETLAAALIRLAGWNPDAPFCDPFCGSGTFAIEAALMARKIAPGSRRKFAFEDFVSFAADAWRRLVDEARAAERVAPAPILASDRDRGAIESARGNAERAGVLESIAFEAKAVSDIAAPAGCAPGWIVTNPPYGHRVSSGGDLRNLYARFGQVARANFPGWQTLFLCAHPAHAHAAGADFSQGPWYNNGGIRVKALALSRR